MKLISKIHDYYDGVVGSTASDRTFTFNRETQELSFPIKSGFYAIPYECYDSKARYTFTNGVIGFCGKLYPYTEVQTRGISDYYLWKTEFYYSLPDFLKDFPEEFISNLKIQGSKSNKLQIKCWLEFGKETDCWTEYTLSTDTELSKIFELHKVAYFAVKGSGYTKDYYKIIAYPILKDYQFFRNFDVFTTFQKIEFFLTNELVKPDKIDIVIPDKLKAQSKGFDKFSFRKEKKV